MNKTSNSINSALLAAPYQLNIWFGSFIWITGNIGCIGNILVFRSTAFRKRAYSIYLLSEAISNFIYFNFVLITRILQKGFQIPVTTRYDIVCKIRQFFSVWGNQVSFTSFSLATIDRILSTQRENLYRQWSNRVLLAYKTCIASALGWLLFIGHRLILYSTKSGTCSPLSGFYAYIDNYIEVVFTAICPPILMILLAYLLIRSVRSIIQRQIVPGNSSTQTIISHRSALQNMDSQLTLMLMLQSIIAIITYIPFAVELIYTNVTQNWSKSPLQIAQEKVFVELTHILSYIFFASSFYISIITNVGFRRQIKNFFRKSQQNAHIFHLNTIYHADTTLSIQLK